MDEENFKKVFTPETIKRLLFIIVLFISSLFIILLFYNKHLNNKLKEKNNIYNSLQDSLKVWKDKNNVKHYRISVLQYAKTKDFLSLQSKDKEIKELQDLVSKYKKYLKEQGSSATIIKDSLVYINTPKEYYPISGDTIIFSKSTLLDTINNKWVKSTYGFDKGKSIFNLQISNEYGIVIGRESQGLFKESKPFVEVTNKNPYSTIKTLRTYQVSVPREKRFGIGPYIGYGFTTGFKPQISVGIGLQYSIIRF